MLSAVKLKFRGLKKQFSSYYCGIAYVQGETVLKKLSLPYRYLCVVQNTYASLGCTCRFEGNTLTIKPDGINKTEIPDELMREMRSSIIYMGAPLGRCGKCGLSFPGGRELGPRPIDMHLSAMKKMGAKVNDEYGTIECTAEHGLKGTKIILKYPSVGTTENIILAAVMAKGETIIMNAAREPEIMDLAAFLNKCGGKIKGAGNSTIVIEGVNELFGCTSHYIMPDRIAAATYISAAASTNGEISIHGIDPALCDSFMCVFEQMGCNIYVYDGCIYVNAKKPLKSVGKIITLPHPGFPTDAQAIIMASLCKANGISIFEETIFENRYRHVDSLVKMGADIKVIGKAAIITGVKKNLRCKGFRNRSPGRSCNGGCRSWSGGYNGNY